MEGRGREGRARAEEDKERRDGSTADQMQLRDKDFFFAPLDLPPSIVPLENPLVTICTSAIFSRSGRTALPISTSAPRSSLDWQLDRAGSGELHRSCTF